MRRINFFAAMAAFSLAVSFFLTACDDFSPIVDKTRSYILIYNNLDSIRLRNYTDRIQLETAYLLRQIQKEKVQWNSTGEKKKKYDSICEAHNDIGYNSVATYTRYSSPARAIVFQYSYIVSIDVRSNSPFDEMHPQNTSLNDIIRVLATTPKPYIESGYKLRFDWKNNCPDSFKQYCGFFLWQMLEDDGVLSDEQRDRTTEPQYPSYFRDYYPIDKTLANLTENDLELSLIPIDGDIEVNTLCYLVFEKTPTLSQTHELTVRIQLSDGRVFSPTITKTWEEESE